MDVDPPSTAPQQSAIGVNNGSQPFEDPWEETINLESKFYAEGYQAGFDHGQLHGLYEGRELGQEKAWEIWEEVGYMEGFAKFWVEIFVGSKGDGTAKGKDARALNHAKQLLSLIATFPTINPTSASVLNQNQPSQTAISDDPTDLNPAPISPASDAAEPDLILLLSAIRSRYKLLCSSIGVRPRLVTAGPKDGLVGTGEEEVGVGGAKGVVMGIEGPMKGVDTRQLRF